MSSSLLSKNIKITIYICLLFCVGVKLGLTEAETVRDQGAEKDNWRGMRYQEGGEDYITKSVVICIAHQTFSGQSNQEE